MISSRVGPFVAFWYCNSYVPRGTFPYLSVNTLRSSHLSSTHVLLKKSHTQTLLMCFENRGIPETLKKCVGMFAFALWDKAQRVLTLARDRIGEKPLYYGWQGHAFLFGSELKAFRGHPEFRGWVNRNSLSLLLRHNCITAPYSISEGIERLLPGTIFQMSLAHSKPGNLAEPVPFRSLAKAEDRSPQERGFQMQTLTR